MWHLSVGREFLHQLPPELLDLVRAYASDRVEPHPTAELIKELTFDRDEEGHRSLLDDRLPSLYVSGRRNSSSFEKAELFLTKRMRKCNRVGCWQCITPGCCIHAKLVSRRVGFRRYLLLDFTEPDRYTRVPQHLLG